MLLVMSPTVMNMTVNDSVVGDILHLPMNIGVSSYSVFLL